jgi:hypothetical protein
VYHDTYYPEFVYKMVLVLVPAAVLVLVLGIPDKPQGDRVRFSDAD